MISIILDILALDQLRADLTSMIFHDLRSPLGNIISSLEVMKSSIVEDDELLEAPRRRHLAGLAAQVIREKTR